MPNKDCMQIISRFQGVVSDAEKAYFALLTKNKATALMTTKWLDEYINVVRKEFDAAPFPSDLRSQHTESTFVDFSRKNQELRKAIEANDIEKAYEAQLGMLGIMLDDFADCECKARGWTDDEMDAGMHIPHGDD